MKVTGSDEVESHSDLMTSAWLVCISSSTTWPSTIRTQTTFNVQSHTKNIADRNSFKYYS